MRRRASMREAIAHVDAGKPLPEDMMRKIDVEGPLVVAFRDKLVREAMAFQDKVGPETAPNIALTAFTMLAAEIASQGDMTEDDFAAFCAATYRTLRS